MLNPVHHLQEDMWRSELNFGEIEKSGLVWRVVISFKSFGHPGANASCPWRRDGKRSKSGRGSVRLWAMRLWETLAPNIHVNVTLTQGCQTGSRKGCYECKPSFQPSRSYICQSTLLKDKNDKLNRWDQVWLLLEWNERLQKHCLFLNLVWHPALTHNCIMAVVLFSRNMYTLP